MLPVYLHFIIVLCGIDAPGLQQHHLAQFSGMKKILHMKQEQTNTNLKKYLTEKEDFA